MKLLLTSVNAVIDFSTGKPFEGIRELFDVFRGLEEGNEVLVISSHKEKLTLLPKGIDSVHFGAGRRGSDEPIKAFLAANPEYDRSKVIVLAANNADFFTAVNTKIFFLAARYAIKNDPESKAFQYGFQMPEIEDLELFFERFFTVQNAWYYRLGFGGNYRVYSLTNANTKGARSKEIIDLSTKFKQCLKEGNEETRSAFIAYFITGLYEIVSGIEKVHYWGVYPSSTVEQDSDLEYFKELARTSFKVMSNEPLFIRHTQAIKRSNIYDGDKRIEGGCENQFETMYINPYYEKKLKGKTVAVIDDFTTYGTSGETVRALLEKAGVEKVIFITLGKFGKLYYKYTYEIEGNVFTPSYTARRVRKPELIYGSINNDSDNAFVTSLKDLV
jgi:hypothetical protein